MIVSFDRSRAEIELVQAPTREDRALFVHAVVLSGEKLSVTFAAVNEGVMDVLDTVSTQKSGTAYKAVVPALLWEKKGPYMLSISIVKKISQPDSAWSRPAISAAFQFELEDAAGADDIKSIFMFRNLEKELESLKPGKSSVLYACDQKNHLWKLCYEGSFLARRDMTESLDGKMDRADAEATLQKKADLTFLQEQLLSKADRSDLLLKADQTALAALAEAVSRKAETGQLHAKADRTYVDGQLAVKADVAMLEAKAEEAQLQALQAVLMQKADKSYVDDRAGKIVYDASSDLTSLHHGFIQGMLCDQTLSMNYSKVKKLVLYWQLDGSANTKYRGRIHLDLTGSGEITAADCLVHGPQRAAGNWVWFLPEAQMDGTKSSLTVRFYQKEGGGVPVKITGGARVYRIEAFS